MKLMLSLIIIYIFSLNSFASEKIYTEEEFTQKLEDRIKRISGEGVAELSRELLKKERTLALQEMELKKKEESLKMVGLDLEKRVKEFQGEQKSFLGCINKNDQDHKKRISHMVSVMSGMRPKTAAEVLSVQDTSIAVKILGRLSPEKVSKIFNSMDKEISARLQKQYMSMKK
jgi:flagellar motility protein MotE (MotC chaperone)